MEAPDFLVPKFMRYLYKYFLFFFLAGNMLLLFRYTYVYICNCICIFAHKYIESRYTCIIYMYMLSTYTLCLVVGGL